MRPLPRLCRPCALLLGGCTTMLMHDKVNRMSGLSGRTRTETLRYMGSAGSNLCHDTADAQIVVPVTENRPSENQAGRIPWQTPKSIRPTSFPRRRESWRKFGNGLFLHKLSNIKQDSRLRGNDGRG